MKRVLRRLLRLPRHAKGGVVMPYRSDDTILVRLGEGRAVCSFDESDWAVRATYCQDVACPSKVRCTDPDCAPAKGSTTDDPQGETPSRHPLRHSWHRRVSLHTSPPSPRGLTQGR